MSALKPGLAVLVVLLGVSSSARAQKVGAVANGGFATFPGTGTSNLGYYTPTTGFNQGYYTINSGFGNYGLPGTYPNYAGYGFAGYGPGQNVGAYAQPVPRPQVYSNMGGLVNTIKQNTGKPGSYKLNNSYGVSGNGRVR